MDITYSTIKNKGDTDIRLYLLGHPTHEKSTTSISYVLYIPKDASMLYFEGVPSVGDD